MARTKSGARIVDVAREAGVSLSTVSRVMNGNPTVDAALAERVRATAKALGYVANPVARSLVLGRTQTIAVVVPDLGNPTFQAILRGLSRAAADDGYHVLVADSAEQVADEKPLAETTRRRTDGVILCAPRLPQAELSELLPRLWPAVVVNRPPQRDAPTVSADYGAAMGELVEHIYGLGHRRVAFLHGVPGSASGAARQEALVAARHAHTDLQIIPLPGGVNFDSGAAAADAVVDAGVTAALAFNDLVAMGLLSALTARGVRVPDDISLTGFDDIPFAGFTTPPLTTAAVPAGDLGVRAWAAMRTLLDDHGPSAQENAAENSAEGSAENTAENVAENAPENTPESVILTPRIVVRGSTARVPTP